MRKNSLWLLLAAAVAVRLLAAQIDAAYQNDVLTFQVWAVELYENGLSNFYGGGFADYPPVYMYVLYVLGIIRSWLGLAYASPAFNLLIRLPAIACDAAAGYFIFTIAGRKTNSAAATVLTAVYLFNPAVILDSAVWGQVDSVYTLLLCVSLYFIMQKKRLPAYWLYGAAIMTKPQSLFLAPIYLLSAYMYLKEHKWTTRSIVRLSVYILSAAGVMLLLALPFTSGFNFVPVFKQYYATLDSYAHGSVNAYNFFALIGGNWAPLSTTFLGLPYTVLGVVFISLITVGAFYALAKDTAGNNLFLVAAALNVLAFMFSVKMHERYLFPALAFFLIALIYSKDKQTTRYTIWLYIGFSVTFFLNCADVLRMLKNGNLLSTIRYTQPVISIVNLTLSVFLLYTFFTLIRNRVSASGDTTSPVSDTIDPPADNNWEVSASLFNGSLRMKINHPDREKAPAYSPPPSITKRDFVLLIALVTVYAALAFYNLGDLHIPQTTWSPNASELAIIDLGEEKDISRIQFMMGAKHDASFIIYASKDGTDWFYDNAVMEAEVFAWTDIPLTIKARYIELIPFGDGLRLQELALRGLDDALLPITSITPEAAALTDEQHLVPESATNMNGTYFDEIYHARTAYEYIHGLTVYENTHPPLGKDLIALSVFFFGMTPFAWRLPGMLIGILMIPLLYQFARYVLRSNKWALFAAFVFTFDFMHFTQTRIATIDTYIVFFAIAMYYFMYRYVREHGMRHLCLSGLCMGLAIASKWQGVYAAAGLPLLFFPVWFSSYKENKKAAVYTLAACVAFFIVIPTAVYIVAYIPYMRSTGGGLMSIINNQRHMFWYHSTLVSEHSFSSRWWEWPLNLVPMYYYANTVSLTLRQGISAFGNPAVWWFGIPVTVYALYSLTKKHDYDLIFLLVAYGAQYLPWVLVSRTTYIYHYFPSVPFVVLLIAYFFKSTQKSTTRITRYTYAYAALVLLLFVLFYPVLSGLPFPVDFVHRFLRWLPGWVLM